MHTTRIHLAYISLLVLLAITVLFSFPYSMYFFATLKASIILIIFMHFLKSEEISKIYVFMAIALLGIAVFGTLDDLVLRGNVINFK